MNSPPTPPAHPWRLLGAAALVLALWGLLDVRNRGVVDMRNVSLHKTDFTVYTEAGAAFFDGRDPYTVTNPRGWGYLYLPLFAMLMAPLHALPPTVGCTVWFFISLATLAGCYFETVWIARACIPRGSLARGNLLPDWLVWGALLTTALPVFNCLQRGQIGVLKLYLLLAGFRLVLEQGSRWRMFLAGVVLALSIALKITPALPVGLLWFEQLLAARRRLAPADAVPRARIGIGGTVAGLLLAILIVPAALVGWNANLRHLGDWWELVGDKAHRPGYDRFAGDSYSMKNQSLSNALHHLGNWADYQFGSGPYDLPFENEKTFVPEFITDKPAFEHMLQVIRLAIVGVAGWLAVRTARQNDPLAVTAVFGLAAAATLIVAPIARAHYFVLLLPGTLFVPALLLREGRPRVAALVAWMPAVLSLVHYAAMDIVGRVGLLGNGITVWYLIAAWGTLGCIARSESRVAGTLPGLLTVGDSALATAPPRARSRRAAEPTAL